MKVNPYKHPFIIIEGIDGCGKSTLIGGIKKWDKKHKIGSIFTKEPTDGEIGQKIRKILDNNGCDDDGHKISAEDLQRLYIWDRLGHRETEASFLEKYPVISDRDFPSTSCYFNAAGGNVRWVLSEHELILGRYFFVPDLVLILDLPAEEAMNRNKKAKKADDYFTKLAFQKRVRDAYLAFPQWMKEIYPEVKMRVVIVDASQPPDKVLKDSLFWIDRTFQEKLEATEYIKIFKKK